MSKSIPKSKGFDYVNNYVFSLYVFMDQGDFSQVNCRSISLFPN